MVRRRHRILVVAAYLALIGGAGVALWSWARHWAPPAGRYPLQGIDLPETPPAIEWSSIKANGATFAYLVATVGADRRSPSFEANWQAAGEAGLRRGAVHLYSLCQDPTVQANAFNTLVARDDAALPAAVEIAFRDDCTAVPESDALVADLTRFARLVETHTGKPVLLRVSRAAERHYGLTAAIHRPVWVMADFVAPGYAARPWTLWRASDIRAVEGVEGSVNWDVVAP